MSTNNLLDPAFDPMRFLRALGVQNPCPLCLRELGPSMAYLAAPVADDDLGRCYAHLMDLPSALADAMRETAQIPDDTRRRAERQIPTVAELESVRQWSAHLGRFVYPGQRVDALSHLIADGKNRS